MGPGGNASSSGRKVPQLPGNTFKVHAVNGNGKRKNKPKSKTIALVDVRQSQHPPIACTRINNRLPRSPPIYGAKYPRCPHTSPTCSHRTRRRSSLLTSTRLITRVPQRQFGPHLKHWRLQRRSIKIKTRSNSMPTNTRTRRPYSRSLTLCARLLLMTPSIPLTVNVFVRTLSWRLRLPMERRM